MPFTLDQLDHISVYMIPTHLKKKPIDQVTQVKPFYDWMLKNREEWSGAGGFLTEPLRVKNEGNGQDYFGADQVGFNSRDPLKRTNWRYYNYHQGLGFDEDTLQAAGIIISDDSETVATIDEKHRLNDLYAESVESMRISTIDDLDLRFHLNGAQSAKAAPGLDYLVSLDPTVGVVGGLDRAQFDFWRNNTFLDIDTTDLTTGPINAAMKSMWRANILHGGLVPDGIFAGQRFLERLESENRKIHHVNANTTGRTGTDFDGAVATTRFSGVIVQHDPTFELLDERFGPLATPWTDRCYMLSSTSMRLRPLQGNWMRQRKPKRMHDRYVHYTAMTSKYGQTANQLNANAVLSIDD